MFPTQGSPILSKVFLPQPTPVPSAAHKAAPQPPTFSLPEEDPSESESQELQVPGVGAGSATTSSPGKSLCLWAAVEAITCLPPRQREAVSAESGSAPSTSPPRPAPGNTRTTNAPPGLGPGGPGQPPACSPVQGHGGGGRKSPRAGLLCWRKAELQRSATTAEDQGATPALSIPQILGGASGAIWQTRLTKNPHSSDPCTRIWLDEAEPRELGSAHPHF